MSENNKNKTVADGGQATVSPKAPTYYVPKWTVDGSGLIGGWSAAVVDREEFYREVLSRGKLILLNAIVPCEGFIFIQKLDTSTAVELLQRVNDVKSFIGHEATAKLLTSLAGREIAYNRGMYAPRPGDVALVIRLRSRTSGDVKDVKPDDLEFLALWYL